MNEGLTYLHDTLGLDIRESEWGDRAGLPLFLRAAADYALCETLGTRFVLATVPARASLPEVKRVHAQVGRKSVFPVVVSAEALDVRQRRALVSQRIPFVTAGVQAFLPFLGLAATQRGATHLRPPVGKLTHRAQATAVWLALHDETATLAEIVKATGMSASAASRAASELATRGIASHEKSGRLVLVRLVGGVDRLLREYMASFSSPVAKVIYARATDAVLALPDAGETALATRSDLNPPIMPTKALFRAEHRILSMDEVLEGELPDDETARLEVWEYRPLLGGRHEVDRVSLALSLAGNDDERVQGAVDSLFGRRYSWREAV